VSKALEFLTSGSHGDLDVVINGAVFSEASDEMVLVRDIALYSLCEHHMLPFHGKAHIAYIPDDKVIGLSKLGRITDHFARRLQVQERLTQQIAGAVQRAVGAKGVAVVIEAEHMCMAMRGVEKVGASTVTHAMIGDFEEELELRDRFFSLLAVGRDAQQSSGTMGTAAHGEGSSRDATGSIGKFAEDGEWMSTISLFKVAAPRRTAHVSHVCVSTHD
jgi:GTP cyclohydrolase I